MILPAVSEGLKSCSKKRFYTNFVKKVLKDWPQGSLRNFKFDELNLSAV